MKKNLFQSAQIALFSLISVLTVIASATPVPVERPTEEMATYLTVAPWFQCENGVLGGLIAERSKSLILRLDIKDAYPGSNLPDESLFLSSIDGNQVEVSIRETKLYAKHPSFGESYVGDLDMDLLRMVCAKKDPRFTGNGSILMPTPIRKSAEHSSLAVERTVSECKTASLFGALHQARKRDIEYKVTITGADLRKMEFVPDYNAAGMTKPLVVSKLFENKAQCEAWKSGWVK